MEPWKDVLMPPTRRGAPSRHCSPVCQSAEPVLGSKTGSRAIRLSYFSTTDANGSARQSQRADDLKPPMAGMGEQVEPEFIAPRRLDLRLSPGDPDALAGFKRPSCPSLGFGKRWWTRSQGMNYLAARWYCRVD